ncbi:MAG: hypothetical protein O6939_07520, partial [Bacteroidetes bacterium]|nr:hypothetical protein [Bacteroidota bacterium]
DIKQLQQIGVARISLGPSLLKVGLSCIKSVAEDLLSYDSKKLFGNNIIASEYIREFVRKENDGFVRGALFLVTFFWASKRK